jgi:hypothetical protein
MLWRAVRYVNARASLQPRVLGFGLLQDGDVGVGVFPEREEVLPVRPSSAVMANSILPSGEGLKDSGGSRTRTTFRPASPKLAR